MAGTRATAWRLCPKNDEQKLPLEAIVAKWTSSMPWHRCWGVEPWGRDT